MWSENRIIFFCFAATSAEKISFISSIDYEFVPVERHPRSLERDLSEQHATHFVTNHGRHCFTKDKNDKSPLFLVGEQRQRLVVREICIKIQRIWLMWSGKCNHQRKNIQRQWLPSTRNIDDGERKDERIKETTKRKNYTGDKDRSSSSRKTCHCYVSLTCFISHPS